MHNRTDVNIKTQQLTDETFELGNHLQCRGRDAKHLVRVEY